MERNQEHAMDEISAAAKTTTGTDPTQDSMNSEQTSVLRNTSTIEEIDLAKQNLLYSILDVPPISQCILLGLQHFITMMSGTAILPTLLFKALCITELSDQSAVISSTFFVMGLATMLQTVLGTRLPIIQGASAAFFAPTFAMLASDSPPACPSRGDAFDFGNETQTIGALRNGTPVWMQRISVVGGTLGVASIFQVLLGATGLTAVMMRYIGPLVVAPIICLIGLSLVPVASASAGGSWPIALLVCILIVLFSYLLDWVHVPVPTIQQCRLRFVQVPLFKSFSVLLSVSITWALCGILTTSGAFPDNSTAWSYAARTDTRSRAFTQASWFRLPYPGQFGMPRVLLVGVLGMMAGSVASVVESMSDYAAAARLSGAPRPPAHAINRGVIMEGLACILAGLFCLPTGSTSYSENIGAIGLTRVGSRRVIQYTACIMIFFGLCPKAGAVFVSLPEPVIGGLFLAMFGMVAGVGLSTLQYANMNNQRNVFIVGNALALGLGVPHWLKLQRPGLSVSQSDYLIAAVDSEAGHVALETLLTLLKNEIFVAGIVAFLMDNCLKGTAADRGLTQPRVATAESSERDDQMRNGNLEIYDIPYGRRILAGRLPIVPPFLPNYPVREGGENSC